MPTRTLSEARRNLIGWIEYWLATNVEGVKTREALSKLMGVSKSTLTTLLDPEHTRAPHLENLIKIHNITGWPIDQLLFVRPPSPKRGTS